MPPAPWAKPCEAGEWTNGFNRSIVNFHNFWHTVPRADGDDVRYGASHVCAAIQSMLESKAGLHLRGLCCRKNERFRKTVPRMYGETGSINTEDELWK
jgi:hypothetical protein